MAYVVTEACIRCKFGDCVEVCPQDAFREGMNFVVIDPHLCANCGLCELACPIGAIKADYALSEGEQRYRALNAQFALSWPIALASAPPPDARQWAAVRDKFTELDPKPAGSAS